MPDLRQADLEAYLTSRLGEPVRVVRLSRLGGEPGETGIKGYGYGIPVLIACDVSGKTRRFVLETMSPAPFGHEDMADRAQMLLWDHRAYNRLPRHVRSLDVGAFTREGTLVSLGEAEEFFLLAEFAEGRGYIEDIGRLAAGGALTDEDVARADALCDYLAAIHDVRGPDPGLYVRRIRELVGHGETVMGLADSYPTRHGFITPDLLEAIEHRCVAWRWRIKGLTHRLRQVHGDFHPWNILFREGTDFTVLDRSRGEWGEPADDVTSLTMNYLFFSLQAHGRLEGPFERLFRGFWDRYLAATGDREILSVAAPFFAFRGLVMASPLWYPALAEDVRRMLFAFLRNVLDADAFDPGRVGDYLKG